MPQPRKPEVKKSEPSETRVARFKRWLENNKFTSFIMAAAIVLAAIASIKRDWIGLFGANKEKGKDSIVVIIPPVTPEQMDSVKPPIAVKKFYVSGIMLDPTEEQMLEDSTGMDYTVGEGLKVEVTYSAGAIGSQTLAGRTLYRFIGSKVMLELGGNRCEELSGGLTASGNTLNRQTAVADGAGKFSAYVQSHRGEIIQNIISCLKK